MGEINIGSILALDERIKEITAELARLKRSRNSILNIARVPPEILGRIFRFNVVPEVGGGRFATVRRGSYNFLLVCHHWFEVARRTPELWSFWGNNLDDWKRRYPLSRAAPVDLVLDRFMCRVGSFDGGLRDALRDCAARDAIRKVHIRAPYGDLMGNAIVSSLTPETEGVQHSSIESIYLDSADASDFFARHHFPKLRDLHLFRNFKISSWDYLKAHTTALVNLSLNFNHATPPSAIPTTSQLLSLLASNPNIRSLILEQLVISGDGGNGSTSPVPLSHLERLSMTGKFHYIFPILHQLELPERIDQAELEFHECNLEEAHETIAPYIRDYLRRDPRFEGRLGVLGSTNGCFVLRACTIGAERHPLDHVPSQNPPQVTFKVAIPDTASLEEWEELCIDTLALLPQESVVYLRVDLSILGAEEVISKMPNIEYLHLVDMMVWEGFLLPGPGEPDPHRKLLPSLRGLCLENVKAEDGYWGPLVTYLTQQTSGNQDVSLNVFGDGVHICTDVLDLLSSLVKGMTYIADLDKECPSDDDDCLSSVYL